MKKRFNAALLVAFCFSVLHSGPVHAATYKFVDKQGTVSFADDLQVIPEEYRAKAVLIEGELKENSEKSAAPVPGPAGGEYQSASGPANTIIRTAPPMVDAQTGGPIFDTSVYTRLIFSGAVMLVVIIGLIALGKVTALKENERTRSVLRSSVVAVFLLYLGIAHAGDVVALFSTAGSKIDVLQQKSAERGRKAAEAMKKMEALSGQLEQMQKEGETQMKELEKGQ